MLELGAEIWYNSRKCAPPCSRADWQQISLETAYKSKQLCCRFLLEWNRRTFLELNDWQLWQLLLPEIASILFKWPAPNHTESDLARFYKDLLQQERHSHYTEVVRPHKSTCWRSHHNAGSLRSHYRSCKRLSRHPCPWESHLHFLWWNQEIIYFWRGDWKFHGHSKGHQWNNRCKKDDSNLFPFNQECNEWAVTR